MSPEIRIEKIEKTDIIAPELKAESSAIVFQRHEKYERDPEAENAGSIMASTIESASQRNKDFFREVIARDEPGSETMILFISSDTQYAHNGYRGMETAQIVQDAAIEILSDLDIDPRERILNLNSSFKTDSFEEHSIRPYKKIREPQIFEPIEYVNYLKETYGKNEHGGLSPQAWGAHERDAAKEKREELGIESVYDMLERTKDSLAIMERYSQWFHSYNPGKKLIIWAVSHYDTISPLVKDATGTEFEQYLPVDYGAGVVIVLEKDHEPTFTIQRQKIVLNLGKKAVANE